MTATAGDLASGRGVARWTGQPAGDLVLPSHDDPVVAGASHLIGGPVGRRARIGGRRFWTVWRVLVALAVLTCTLGWAQKAQCRDTRNWSHADGVYQYTRLCYSDVVALYGSEGLEPTDQLPAGKTPYVDQAVEYPVLIGAAMEGARLIADLRPGSHSEAHGQFSEDERAAAFYAEPWGRRSASQDQCYIIELQRH